MSERTTTADNENGSAGEKARTTISIRPTIHTAGTSRAAELHRSFSNYVEWLIATVLTRKEQASEQQQPA